MPKPVWVERKNNERRAQREGAKLLDNDNFLDALDDIEEYDDAEKQAKDNPAKYFRDKGVELPEGLEILEASRGSCTYCYSVWGIKFCVTFP